MYLPTYNVDVVHISCRDLLTNLLYQVQSELDIVRLAGLGVDIPHKHNWMTGMKRYDPAYHRLR